MSRMKDFLWYSYFGITFEEAKDVPEKAQATCIQRAYRNLCRTLNYSKSGKTLKGLKKEEAEAYDNIKEDFKEEEKKYIAKVIDDLFKKLLEETLGFDEWHKETCNGIISIADSSGVENDNLFSEKGFSYGQAQKWLNMTLKYMLLMGLWKDMQKIEGSKEHLHIPVDAEHIKSYLGIVVSS